MRSTLDAQGVCDVCRPGVADGTIVLRRVGRDTVHAVPVAVAPFIRPDVPEPVTEPVADVRIEFEVPIAEPKQRPVKRRWWRGRR